MEIYEDSNYDIQNLKMQLQIFSNTYQHKASILTWSICLIMCMNMTFRLNTSGWGIRVNGKWVASWRQLCVQIYSRCIANIYTYIYIYICIYVMQFAILVMRGAKIFMGSFY